ncbi:10097_t:CDS:1, partial [Racocetra persica]
TKSSKDLHLINFINGTTTSISSTSQSSLSNTDAIVGDIIGFITFVGILVAFGIILHRRGYKTKISNPLINTNNQACTDTNSQ